MQLDHDDMGMEEGQGQYCRPCSCSGVDGLVSVVAFKGSSVPLHQTWEGLS